MKGNQFAKMAQMLDALKPDVKNGIINAHKQFGTLRSLCEAKGWIETMPQLKGIKVIKNKPEVKELKKVIDILKPSKFIWDDTAITGASLKDESAGSLKQRK